MTKDQCDCLWLYHWTKGFMVINATPLVVAFGNKASCMPGNRTISVMFESKIPFVPDDIKI